MKVRDWDCCGYTIASAFRQAAALLGEAGAKGSMGVAAPDAFSEALAQHCPGSVHTAPSWPWPGVFYQLPTGWVHVVADDRLDPGTARLVDAVSGKYVELRNLG